MKIISIPLIIEQILLFKGEVIGQNDDMQIYVVHAVEHGHLYSPLREH